MASVCGMNNIIAYSIKARYNKSVWFTQAFRKKYFLNLNKAEIQKIIQM